MGSPGVVEFYPINPLVDLYNSVSMAWRPLLGGGGDMDRISGWTLSRQAKEANRSFHWELKKMRQLWSWEIIYYDQEGAVCRCLNWRAQRTMLTGRYQAMLFWGLKAIDEEQAKRAQTAMQGIERASQGLLFWGRGNDLSFQVQRTYK